MIKKTNALLMILMLGAGCRQQAADSTTVVRFLAGPDVGGFAKEIINDFEAQNPDIRIEMVEGPAATNTREDMYAASFMAKEDTYDLVYMDVAWLPKFAAQGWLSSLDDLFAEKEQKKFLSGDIAGSRYQEKIYRLPIQSDGGMLYYRKDLLAKAGLKPPVTWDEMTAAAKKIQSPPQLWGFVFQGKQYEALVCVFLEMLWSHGGDLINENDEVLVDRPEGVQALERLVNAVHQDKISPEGVLTFQEEETRHMFQEGKAVFMRNWPYAWNLLQAEGSPVKGKVGMIPMVRGSKNGKSAATLGGWGYGISAFSKNREAAWKFIEFAGRPENQKTAFFKGGIIPTRRALFEDPEVLKASPHMKELLQVLSAARPRPVHPRYAQISDVIQTHVSAALSRQVEPKEALAAAAREIREILNRS